MDAIKKGTAVKTKAAEVLTTLGMPVPDALKS
jgi:antitoxin component of RelBE/YafQ-DinJ toxin-antitoxin module